MNTKQMNQLLIIIPAYNEEANIERVVENIRDHYPEYDYVVINDCSKDNTLEICHEHNFNVVNLPVNMGIGGGVQTGYMYAYRNGYDIAVQFDGDGQHNASYLDSMSKKLVEENLDMVIGSRYIEKEGFQSSGMRRMGIKYFTGLIKLLTGKKITDPTSGMRMINRKIMKQFSEEYPKDYPEPESIVTILKEGAKVEEIPVKMNAREEGVSSISPSKSSYYMVKVSIAVLIAAIRK